MYLSTDWRKTKTISDTVLRAPKHREGNRALLWLETWSQKRAMMLPSVRSYIWDQGRQAWCIGWEPSPGRQGLGQGRCGSQVCDGGYGHQNDQCNPGTCKRGTMEQRGCISRCPHFVEIVMSYRTQPKAYLKDCLLRGSWCLLHQQEGGR